MGKLKIISFNTQGLKSPNKRKKVLNWATRKHFDIMAIQESHYIPEDKESWEETWKGRILSSAGCNNSRGVTFLLAANLEHQLEGTYRDTEGRWIILDIIIQNTRFTIANYYGPNDDNPIHVINMIGKIEELSNSHTILCGDFNFVFDINKDKLNGNHTTNFKCRNTVSSWMTEANIQDIWRIKNPNKRQYTWTSNTKPPIMCRLDFFLVSGNINGHYKNCDIVPGYRSDHSCITLNIDVNEETRGRGFWKFNSELLLDQEFKKDVKKTILDISTTNAPCEPDILWDTMKCAIRGICISHSVKNKKNKQKRVQEATWNIQKLEEARVIEMIGLNSPEKIEEIEADLTRERRTIDEVIEEDTEAAAKRSKCDWYEAGDTNSKLFLNLEKSRAEQKCIRRLEKEDGSITTDAKEIMEEEYSYYKKLYTSSTKKNHENKDLFTTESPKISEEYHQDLTSEITEDEIWKIIKTSPLNKSPGIDGFTTEFYIEFWPWIKDYMIQSFRTSLDKGFLSTTQRRGVISMIPKPGKDLDKLKNWRPITLLNQDYKIIAKVMANRCKKLLPSIIGTDQSGFVEHRYIGCNIMRLHNLIDLCKEEELNGLLLNIDFEKAFDSIEWSHIYKALSFFNFPDQYIKWIKCFYNQTETCIINNGHATPFFTPGRGVRQGCPLSPYLFVISVELMTLWIKQRTTIEGIKSKSGDNYIISQFADDTTIAITEAKDNIRKTFEAIETFGATSGLKLNIDKTEIILLGKVTELDIPKRYRHQIKKEVKCLGLKISTDLANSTMRNYGDIQDKMTITTEKWNKRKASLAGKINIVKSLISSKLVYAMTNLPSPKKEFWTTVNHSLYKFINNGKSEKMKREVLIGPYEEGGYKMVDLESQNQALKLSWIPRLVQIEGVWRSYVLDKLPTDVRYLARCNLKYSDLPFKFPKTSIWNEIWLQWCLHNYSNTVDTTEQILNQNIWFNSHIKVNNKLIYMQKWEEKGIRWISDLILEDDHLNFRFLGLQELLEMYDIKVDFLTYGGIIQAIPPKWRNILKNPAKKEGRAEEEGDYKLLDKLIDHPQPTRLIYDIKIKNKSKRPAKPLGKWMEDLGHQYEDDELLKCHFNQRRIIINQRIKSFNYLFLQRNVPYGGRLHKMKLVDSEECALCKTKETLKHLYWDCPNASRLWERLKFIVEKYLHSPLHLDATKCMLGIGHWICKRNKECIWFLCILTKHYIHLNKCNNTEMSGLGLENYIKSLLRIERLLATKRGKQNLFSTKWGDIMDWLDNKPPV